MVLRYDTLTKTDTPKGPFFEAVKSASKIFFLRPLGNKDDHTGYLSESDLIAAITDVPLTCVPNSVGGETISMQAPSEENVRVHVLDAGGTISGEPALLPLQKRKLARKKVIGNFCKLYSWGWDRDGRPLLYNGRGLSRTEVSLWREEGKPPWLSGGEVSGEHEREISPLGLPSGDYVDGADPKADPIEIVVIAVGGLHMAPGGVEYSDFVLGPAVTCSFEFKQYYRQKNGALLKYEDVKQHPSAFGFIGIRPSGADLVGKRIRLFSDSKERHGWHIGTVQVRIWHVCACVCVPASVCLHMCSRSEVWL